MELRKLSLRVESGESVTVLHARDLLVAPDALHVRLGDVCLVGSPAAVVDLLSRALQQCYSAWGDGRRAGLDDGPDGAGPQTQVSLPPVTEATEVGDALSRLARARRRSRLALTVGHRSQTLSPLVGGGIGPDVYRMDEGGGQ